MSSTGYIETAGGRHCINCSSVMREYLGLNGRLGEGELYCPRCDGVVERVIEREETQPIRAVNRS